MKLVGIYKINSPSGRIYIGQSIDISRRFRYYKNLKCKEQPKLYNSFIKYGVDAHKFEIIDLCLQKYLNNMERYYQNKFYCVNAGLNMMYVKNEHFSGNHSEETKKKLSEHFKGKKPSERAINRLIQYNKTRVLSQESRDKMSKANKGRKHTPEAIANMVASRIGKKRSSEAVQNLINSSPNKKPVIQYDLDMNFIAEYPSVRQAYRELGKKLTTTNINQCLIGTQKTAFGYIWRYKKC